MASSTSNPDKTSSARHARLLLPVVGAGILAAMAVIWISKSNPSYGEAQVLRTIHQIALTHSDQPGVADGGLIGPWWISASGVDPVSGDLFDFSITSGSMIIAAKSARIEIDPHQNTFGFALDSVVMTRVAARNEEERDEHFLLEYDHYRLGPAPFGADIIPDGGSMASSAPRQATDDASPLAGVTPP